MLLWQFMNVHRNAEKQREPFSWETIQELLGHSTGQAAQEPTPEDLKAHMAGFVEYWNQIPDGPRTG